MIEGNVRVSRVLVFRPNTLNASSRTLKLLNMIHPFDRSIWVCSHQNDDLKVLRLIDTI